MELIDTHCHLTYPQLQQQGEAVFSRAAAVHVGRMITVGADPEDARAAQALAKERPNVFFTAGIHPNNCADFKMVQLAVIESLLADEKAVAVGEAGLDYHYDHADRDRQKAVFKGQIDLARRRDKPLVIHCRNVYDDCLALLDVSGPILRGGVFHCFTGTAAQAAAILDRGYLLSFTGIVTFSNAKDLQTVAATVPADRLMLETDAPYLSPVPVRKIKVNQPAHLLHTAKFLADLRDVSLTKLAEQTTANAVRFFRLT